MTAKNENKKSKFYVPFHGRHFSSHEEHMEFNRVYFEKLEAKNAKKEAKKTEVDVPKSSDDKKTKKEKK